MRFHVYLVLDENGEWAAGGLKHQDEPELIDMWCLRDDMSGETGIFRIEVDAPEVPEKFKPIAQSADGHGLLKSRVQ